MGKNRELPLNRQRDSYKEGWECMLSLGSASCGLPKVADALTLYKNQSRNIEVGTSPSARHTHFAEPYTQ